MSSAQYKALKGMQDILPPDVYLWQKVEKVCCGIFASFGFQEVRLPVVEATNVFTRSIGENTDIVEKEMYTFTDKGNRSISLRPEGTASVVRSYVEKNLQTMPPPQKFYYSGPMFRYERPQSGRFRQFYQIGVEAFGDPNPVIDAEVISMLRHCLLEIGLKEIKFNVNSIGCSECRPVYREKLLEFFGERLSVLCPDCNRRYHTNPLRILDCKVDRCRKARENAPRVTDFLCSVCRTHFDSLLSYLEILRVPCTVNPDMVRGLDYYTRTTFEVTSEHLGSQNAVAAGGRYDRLVKEFGGPDTPAVGFAMGMERIVELLKGSNVTDIPTPDLFFAVIGIQAVRESMVIGDRLRVKGYWVETGDSASSLKSQMRRADRVSAKYVFIMGDDELKSGRLKWKRLSDSAQGEVSLFEITEFLQKELTHTI
jgi:histidyl-tRNA synthetase